MPCGLSCFYERRHVRKDLLRWSRSVLITAGLEDIVNSLVGDDIWREICPISSLILDKSVNFVWADFQADICPWCEESRENKLYNPMCVDEDSGICSSSSSTPPASPRVDVLKSLSNELCDIQQQSSFQGPSPLLGPIYDPNRESMFRMQAVQHYDMMSQMKMLGMIGMAPAAPGLPLSFEMQRLILENQIPFSNPFMPNPQMIWNMPMMVQMQRLQAAQREQAVREKQTELKAKEDMPLDLSRKSGLESVADFETTSFNNKNRKQSADKESLGADDSLRNGYNMKRNYSQVDLNAAVNDIRCGKLGTRRASVVYGIPRSTLRNKIYKLEAAEELTGQQLPYKRRRPGGQSSAEKRLADQVEREKKASTPVTDCSSISPNSDVGESNTDSFIEKSDNTDVRWDNDWTTNLWQSLFKQQQTQMTADIMNAVPKEEQKKDESSDWKKSRPKRGQYRKYDKNALDEAVQSVRRGEMSVHRAGSYYGVPHSTLEYKVKERNLMRKKKERASPHTAALDDSSAINSVESDCLSDALMPPGLPSGLTPVTV